MSNKTHILLGKGEFLNCIRNFWKYIKHLQVPQEYV